MKAWLTRALAISGLVFALNPGVEAQDSESCGICHKSHYREWLQSPHSKAWEGPDVQLQVQASGNQEFCAGCHAPQSVWKTVEMTVSGLEATATKSPAYTPEMEERPKAREEGLADGVSCGVCHRIVILWNEGSRSDEFLGPFHTELGHGGKESAAFGAFQLCRSCHGRSQADYLPEGSAGKDLYHKGTQPFAFAMETDCAACHMPVRAGKLVQLSVFKEAPERTVREHTFAVNHYKGLATALEMQIGPGDKLILTNKGVGHPLGLSLTSKYRLAISRLEGEKILEEKKLDFSQARSLTPGASIQLDLPFAYQGERSIRVDLIRVMKGDAEGKIFSKTL